MNTVFCVDGNWYLHRVWYTLNTKRPIEEVLPNNFLSLVMKDACAVGATHVLVAFDGAKVFRYKVYPAYKANRDGPKGESTKDDEGGKQIYEYLKAVRDHLTEAGICWVQNSTHEADDVNASAAVQYSELPDTVVVLGAKDKDVYQVLSSKVRLYDSSAKPTPRFITQAKAEKAKGVGVSKMVMYQTLIGDKIDNIPSLMRPATAQKTINKWKSFKDWFDKGTDEDRRWLRVNQVKLRLNRQLVELKKDLSIPSIAELKVPKLKRQGMPKAWYVFQDLTYPKMKGLFKR